MRSVSKLEMQRRATGKAPGHSSRPQHPAPYLRPRTGKPSKRSTRPTLCFQHVGPTSYGPRSGVAHPAGNGLVLHLLRATVWCCASCGPRFGVAHPAGHGLVFRLLRATVWCFASFGLRFGASPPEGRGLVLRILRATDWCFASYGPRPRSCISEELPIAFNGCVLMTWRVAVWWCCVSGKLLDSWVSGGLQRFCISEEPTWSRTSRRLRVGAEYRRD